MKRYYIKAWFHDWQEVSKEKADQFIDGLIKRTPVTMTGKKLEEFIAKHYKEEENG